MKYAIAFMLMTTTAAVAQQSTFAPITITEQDAKNLRQFLDEQPMKFGLPILQWLDALEQRAVKEAEKKDAPEK